MTKKTERTTIQSKDEKAQGRRLCVSLRNWNAIADIDIFYKKKKYS